MKKKVLVEECRKHLHPDIIELLEKPVIVDIIETFDGVLIDVSIRHEDPQIDQS